MRKATYLQIASRPTKVSKIFLSPYCLISHFTFIMAFLRLVGSENFIHFHHKKSLNFRFLITILSKKLASQAIFSAEDLLVKKIVENIGNIDFDFHIKKYMYNIY